MEEFRRAGAEVVFLNRPIGGSAEDDLLLQIQGVIAEYERARILERSRRRRRHAARSGLLSAFTTAPFGDRYVTKDQGGGVARFEVVAEEAVAVRLIFPWIGLERLSLREVCRRLQRAPAAQRAGARCNSIPRRSAACWPTLPISAAPSTAIRATCRPGPAQPGRGCARSAAVVPPDRAGGGATCRMDRGARAGPSAVC